jgi:hypothetical protein
VDIVFEDFSLSMEGNVAMIDCEETQKVITHVSLFRLQLVIFRLKFIASLLNAICLGI